MNIGGGNRNIAAQAKLLIADAFAALKAHVARLIEYARRSDMPDDAIADLEDYARRLKGL